MIDTGFGFFTESVRITAIVDNFRKSAGKGSLYERLSSIETQIMDYGHSEGASHKERNEVQRILIVINVLKLHIGEEMVGKDIDNDGVIGFTEDQKVLMKGVRLF